MWEVIHICLSFIGVLLLVLLLIILTGALLILFFPVSYRFHGRKGPDELSALFLLTWLFGIIRVKYVYPEPKALEIRLLGFRLFNNDKLKTDRKKKNNPQKNNETPDAIDNTLTTSACDTKNPEKESAHADDILKKTEAEETKLNQSDKKENAKENKFNNTFEKIKYTIRNVYDKIKHIWDNIYYYKQLLYEPETNMLWQHVKFRMLKILKSIRPRKLKGSIIFGTGAADTTGYAYGFYCMVMPFLGSGLIVVPDFDVKKLEGTVYLSGHITFAVLLWHTLCILLDKKLRIFINKLKARRKTDG